jgi:hypothetical protein
MTQGLFDDSIQKCDICLQEVECTQRVEIHHAKGYDTWDVCCEACAKMAIHLTYRRLRSEGQHNV